MFLSVLHAFVSPELTPQGANEISMFIQMYFPSPLAIPTRHVSTCDFTLQMQSLPQKLQQLKAKSFFPECLEAALAELLTRSNSVFNSSELQTIKAPPNEKEIYKLPGI